MAAGPERPHPPHQAPAREHLRPDHRQRPHPHRDRAAISTSRHSEKRRLLLAALEHELIRAEWEEFEAATATVRQQLLEGAGNRLRKFLSSPIIRQVLGQQEHVLDIDRIVAEKKILLVNLAPGMKIDRENANLLGILIINELFRAALLRNPDTELHPFFLYIDEFAQLITPTVANILDECRKYGLFLTLAHQHLAQLTQEDEWLFASILANCHNRCVFGGLNVEDAELLARQVYTGFEDLKQVKHTDWQTKFRPVEEERIVRTRSRGKSRSRSESSPTPSASRPPIPTRSPMPSAPASRGRSPARRSSGVQQSQGQSLTLSDQRGGQRSDTVSREKGIARSNNWSDGKSEQETYGQSTGETHQDGTSRSRQETANSGRSSDPHGSLVQRQQSGSEGTTDVATASNGTSLVNQSSRGISNSHQQGGGASLTVSEGNAHSDGSSWGRGEARAVSRQDGTSRSTGVTATDTASRTRPTRSPTAPRSRKAASARRDRETRNRKAESEAESIVPFLSLKEFQEGRLIFWTPQEIELMRTGQMKEQPTGVATVKIGPAAPVQVKIDTIAIAPYRGEATERAVAELHDRVAQAFPEFYATPEEVQQEIDGRQMKIFGEVMRLDLKPARLVQAINGEAVAVTEPQPAAAGQTARTRDGRRCLQRSTLPGTETPDGRQLRRR